jgi:hypothetical protein
MTRMQVVAVCLLAIVSPELGAQTLQPPPALKNPTPTGPRAFVQTAANTLVFDHYNLQPAQPDPMVLRLADGEYFQVRIINTDNTLFVYTISAVPDEEVPGLSMGPTGPGIAATRLGETTVTMRHYQAFARYRVKIAPRADLAGGSPVGPRDTVGAGTGAQPPAAPKAVLLFPAVFDVWVETKPGFEVTFTGGAVFSGLRSRKYSIKTDTRGTTDAADDLKTVEEDPDARDDFWPDTVAVANFRHPEKFRGVGIAAGVGLNNDAEPRFFLGPSYFLGRNLLLTGGWMLGRVDRLPTGQEVGKAPIAGENTLTNLPKRFKNTFYLGFAFSFIPKAEENFKGAFAAAQKTVATPAAQGGAQAPAVTPGGALAASTVSGEYTGSENRKATVKGAADGKLAITLPGETEVTMEGKGAVFTNVNAGVSTSCSFETSADKKTITMTCLRNSKPLFTGTKSVTP